MATGFSIRNQPDPDILQIADPDLEKKTETHSKVFFLNYVNLYNLPFYDFLQVFNVGRGLPKHKKIVQVNF